MIVKNYFLPVLLAAMLAACGTSNNRFYAPPGCVRASDGNWIDQRPLTNMDYWEYLGWTMQVYGRQSDEFRRIYPDTTGNGEEVRMSLSDADTMPQHKTYFVPKSRFEENLCCVSLQQLAGYCQWRTELVYWKQRLHGNKCLDENERHLVSAPRTFWETATPERVKDLPPIGVYQLPDDSQRELKANPEKRIPAAVRTVCRFIPAQAYLEQRRR